jgi:hypothetical protein
LDFFSLLAIVNKDNNTIPEDQIPPLFNLK